jgi:hypothetical protein
MKALATTFGLLILTILVATDSLAQKAAYTINEGWTFGVGAGKAYQKSDIAYSDGLGFDLTLGSKLYHQEHAFLSVDWKFRFLAGENKNYDLSLNNDNTIHNVRYRFYSYDLELGLTLNRLRERTRIVLSGFAGAGLTHGRTSTDLYDAENNPYDYSSIDLTRDNKSVYRDLLTFSDGNYETPLLHKAAVLPTAGLFIGYQISRSITAGFEFKTNFYLTEKNSLVGIDLDNRILTGSFFDRNNYLSLGLSWTLRGRSSTRLVEESYAYPETVGTAPAAEAENLGSQHSVPGPSVFITDPSADAFSTVSRTHTLWAIVTDVSGSEHISFYQNGFPNQNFSYNKSTNMFLADVHLKKGENRFRIEASNQTSAAEDMVTITLEDPQETLVPAAEIGVMEPGDAQVQPVVRPVRSEYPALPTINFIQPSEHIYVENNFFPLKVAIQHVSGRKDVSVALNGRNVPNFSFYHSGVLTVTLLLAEGTNTIDVIAENAAGMASASNAITYQKPVHHLPVYREPVIQEPVSREPVTQEPVVREPVSNEPMQRRPVTREPYTPRPVTHRPGTREPVTQEPVTEEPVTQDPVKETRPCTKPEIRLIDPTQSQSTTQQPSYTLKAEVQHIEHNNQLRLTVNGNPVAFRISNRMLSSSIPLGKGMNAVVLKAVNACGEAKASARIIHRPAVVSKPCTPPEIRINVQEVSRNDATHELRGTVSGITSKAEISLTVNGRTNPGFQFVPSTGELTAKLNLTPGSHTLVLTATNACGSDTKSESLKIVEVAEASGIRINPGNADWQFCLATPSGTYSREQLSNSNFSYSGRASSLYFQPIGGGGEALVNGRPYPIKSGQYYLFTGNLTVTVSTKNPGSMGHWSVRITTDRVPVSGNGSKRPKSPCEQEKSAGNMGKKPGR